MSETRERLLDAAEQLFAEKGLHRTSAREIVDAAGQRNASAIQYHFGGRSGLLEALTERRMHGIEDDRRVRLDALGGDIGTSDTRAVLACLVDPVLERCRDDSGFRAYLRAFGELSLSPGLAIAGNRTELESMQRVRAALAGRFDAPPAVLSVRVEALTRFVLQNISMRARSDAGFEDPGFARFRANLLDMAVGLLTAEVSAETGRAYAAD